MSAAPKVIGHITRRQEVDFRASLDGWTVAELEDYIEGDDDEGADILASDAHVVSDDVDDLDVPPAALREYLAWRRDNGHTERIT